MSVFHSPILGLLIGIGAYLFPFSHTQAQPTTFSQDVWYHIFVRSFYDSNDDRHGDLKGITQKLDYLQELGITGIMLSPIQDADCYHNYFSNDFYRIDPRLGTMDDFLELRKETRKRNLRLILDMEMQYVTDKHPWFKDSYQNPASPYTPLLRYHDTGNTQPEGGVWGLHSYKDWQGKDIGMISVDMTKPETLQEMIRLFSYWSDPNQDGNPNDGVDGFRIDHMMDDLDNKGLIKNLYPVFWKPLIKKIKQHYPKVFFIGEQANWGFDAPMFSVAGADAQFGFVQWYAFQTARGHRIRGAVDSTRSATPGKHFYLTFVENHDTNRTSLPLQTATALTLLTGGVPVLYYGQEIGMKGTKGDWGHDGNDIPMRQAFRWQKDREAAGSAIWYKADAPWWIPNFPPDDDLTSQQKNPDSTWRFYKKWIAFRKQNPLLFSGKLYWLPVSDDTLLAFERREKGKRIRIWVNLSAQHRTVFQNQRHISFAPFEIKIMH